MRRNKLRWFEYVNRAISPIGYSSVIKKTMFAYFHDEKHPRNIGRKKNIYTKPTCQNIKNVVYRYKQRAA